MSVGIAIRSSLKAIRSNLLPGIGLQLLSLCIILSYYNLPVIRVFWDKISDLKEEGGVLFAMLSTGFFGGVLPGFVLQLSKTFRQKNVFKGMTFGFLFWAYKGYEINLLYKLQAKMFGDDTKLSTIVCKVFVDEFIYVPTLGAVSILLAYVWKENNYKIRGMKEALGEKWYINKALPMIVSSWFIWIPTVSIIYSLPLSLQLPVQNLILCFWTLIVVFLTTKPVLISSEPDLKITVD